jgi:ABC-type transport system involved in multi-copper enzyme maturation permease subunit
MTTRTTTHARFRALLAVEAAKALRQPGTLVLGGILVGYLFLIIAALASVLGAPAGAGFDPSSIKTPLRADAVGFVGGILTGIALILLVVFTAQLMGQEFSRGTLRTLLLARARRTDVALAKLALLALVSASLALVVLAGGVVGAWVFSQVTGEALLKPDARAWGKLALQAFAAFAAWAALAFGTTLATRSLGVGIGATLGAMIAGDVLRGLIASLGQVGLWVSRLLPNAAIAAVSGNAPLAASDWAWIVPNLAFYVVGLNALAIWKLQTMDVIAATK